MSKSIAPVVLIFFNRPQNLQQVFDEVKKARPPRLYLIQDGPRVGNKSDEENIQKCRDIVENIDWPCEVYKNYSLTNLGCGRRPYTGISWVFEKEEKAIILEDDCVPSQSFFKFSSEMLERYNNDNRIFLITGMNMELQTRNCPDSYFFGYSGTNWGWATWKRSWDLMDYNVGFIDNDYISSNLKMKLKQLSDKKGIKEYNIFLDTSHKLKNGENISYWDVQFQAVRYLYSQLSIIPTKNLITNIGLGDDATHSLGEIPKNGVNKKVGEINFFYNERYEMDFPLKHPKYIIQNVKYDEKVDKKIHPNIFKRIKNKIQYLSMMK